MTIKHYACQNCGHPFEACAPDDVYIIASRRECLVYGSKVTNCLMTQTYECDNCSQSTTLYWHRKRGHTSSEIKKAKQIMSEALKTASLDEI